MTEPSKIDTEALLSKPLWTIEDLASYLDVPVGGLRKQRAEVVAAFPQYLAFTEPAPLSVAETQALLSYDEAVVVA